MNHLLRGVAPLSDGNWQLLDEEAGERLHGPLAARRLVDFDGPHGWDHSATNLGRTESAPGSRSSGPSWSPTTAAPSTPTSSRSTRRRCGSPPARTSRSSTAGPTPE